MYLQKNHKPKGSSKTKQEKVGLCPTFGEPPPPLPPHQYGTPITDLIKRKYTRYYTLLLVSDGKFHLKSGTGNDPSARYGTKSRFFLLLFLLLP